MTMETCNNSLTISVSTRNKYILLFIPLNSSGMKNSMCESEINSSKFMKRTIWSIFSTSLNLWSSNSIFVESAPSYILLSWIVGDAWSKSLWFSKISWDSWSFDCSFISKSRLDCLSKTSIVWSHESCILAMLLDMSLTIFNIWLTCFDIVCCSLRLKLWYRLDMIYLELDAKTEFSNFFFFGVWVMGTSVWGFLFGWG